MLFFPIVLICLSSFKGWSQSQKKDLETFYHTRGSLDVFGEPVIKVYRFDKKNKFVEVQALGGVIDYSGAQCAAFVESTGRLYVAVMAKSFLDPNADSEVKAKHMSLNVYDYIKTTGGNEERFEYQGRIRFNEVSGVVGLFNNLFPVGDDKLGFRDAGNKIVIASLIDADGKEIVPSKSGTFSDLPLMHNQISFDAIGTSSSAADYGEHNGRIYGMTRHPRNRLFNGRTIRNDYYHLLVIDTETGKRDIKVIKIKRAGSDQQTEALTDFGATWLNKKENGDVDFFFSNNKTGNIYRIKNIDKIFDKTTNAYEEGRDIYWVAHTPSIIELMFKSDPTSSNDGIGNKIDLTPKIKINPPDCFNDGTATIEDFDITSIYYVSVSGQGDVSADVYIDEISGRVIGMLPDVRYTIKRFNGYFTSDASVEFSILAKLSSPEDFLLTGNAICSLQSLNSGIITINTSEIGVDYQLYNASNTKVQGVREGTGLELIWSNLSAGMGYYVIATNTDGCTTTRSIDILTKQNPPPPIASVTVQPTCLVPTGTIVVSVPTPGANVEYTLTGNNPVVPSVTQDTPTFVNVAPGNYSLTTTDIVTGCESEAISLTVNAIPPRPNPPIASVTVHPTCPVSEGTIVVTSPAPAPDVKYTLTDSNSLTISQSSPVFTNLSPGNYSITTTNEITKCESDPIVLTVNDNPSAPPLPVAETIHVTCIILTGTIEVKTPVPGNDIEYTLTGENPVVAPVTQNTPIFFNLLPGVYKLIATNKTTLCTSASASIEVKDKIIPSRPIANVTIQPTCLVSTGTIVVSVPTPGANVEYTLTGNNPVVPSVTQDTPTFVNVAPGNYSLTTTDIVTGCESEAISLTVNAIPPLPNPPVASVTAQPTCLVQTGIIVVSAPTPGANVEYTLTGNNLVVPSVTQDTPTFVNVAPGNYSLTTTDIVTGCESGSINLTVNDIPLLPATPEVSITHPTCIIEKGTIEVNLPIPSNSLYTLRIETTGEIIILPSNNTRFVGLEPGNYTLNVLNEDTRCTSSISITINTIPPPPATPIVNVTQPSCPVPMGIIEITSPAPDSNIEFVLTDSNFGSEVRQSGSTFSNLLPEVYILTAVNTVTGCESLSTTITINDVPSNPVAPLASVTKVPACPAQTGTIEVIEPLPAPNVIYTLTGINPVVAPIAQESATFDNLSAGDYSLTTTNTLTGCVSSFTLLVVPDILCPDIDLIKTAQFNDENGDSYAQVDETITYKFTITNTGRIVLANITLSDLLPGLKIERGKGVLSLAAGESNSTYFTGTYTIKQTDIDARFILNEATVFGESLNGNVQDTSGVRFELDPGSGCKITVYNAISPNNDGKNDFLKIEGLECHPNNSVRIYNRWGVLVYEKNQYNNLDNTFKGMSEGRFTIKSYEGLPSGTYFYVLRYEDYNFKTHQKSGYLYLGSND